MTGDYSNVSVGYGDVLLTKIQAEELTKKTKKGKPLSSDEFIALERYYENLDIQWLQKPTGPLVQKFEQQLKELEPGTPLFKIITKAVERNDYQQRVINVVDRTKEKNSTLYLFGWPDWFNWFNGHVTNRENEYIALVSSGALIERVTALNIFARRIRSIYPAEQLEDWKNKPRKYSKIADRKGNLTGEEGIWKSPVVIHLDKKPKKANEIIRNANVIVNADPIKKYVPPPKEIVDDMVSSFLRSKSRG